jgi:hypothetical protein
LADCAHASRWVALGIALVIGTAAPVLGQFELEPAKDRVEADVYAGGALTTAQDADTVYAWDIKLTYPRIFRALDREQRRWLSTSPILEFVANKGTDVNPDRARVGGQVGLLFDRSEAIVDATSRPTITEVQWLTDVAGEFDRGIDTKGWIAASFARFLFRTFGPPPAPGSSRALAFVPLLDGGVEMGSNVRNRLDPEGSGAIARLYGGVNVFQELGRESLVLTATYQVRGLLRDEVFARKINGTVTRVLDSETRSFLDVGLDVGLMGFASVRPRFRRGSLPPAYSFVDNEFSITFEFKGVVPR